MDAKRELLDALQTLLEVGKYSDLQITCGEKSWAVHRVIICSRSGFFDGACSHGFREAESGVINLTEDDPDVVEQMINYFYKLDYMIDDESEPSTRPVSLQGSPISTHFCLPPSKKVLDLAMIEDPLLVTAAAHSSFAQEMTKDAVSGGSYMLPDNVEPAALDLQELSLDTPSQISARSASPIEIRKVSHAGLQFHMRDSCDSHPSLIEDPGLGIGNLTMHAKVYAIADKYQIAGLKALARQKFQHQAASHYISDDFVSSMREAYESTVESDRGLRDVIISMFRSHPELLRRKDVGHAVKDIPGLAWELVRIGWGLPSSPP